MGKTNFLITDAAKQVQVENHVLRYWEEELGLHIKRNEMGHRFYSRADIERFRRIKQLKDQGIQLKAIRVILDRNGEQIESLVKLEADMKLMTMGAGEDTREDRQEKDSQGKNIQEDIDNNIQEKNPQQEDSQVKNIKENIKEKNSREKNPQQEDGQGKNRQEKNTQEKNSQQEENQEKNMQKDIDSNPQEKKSQQEDSHEKNRQEDMHKNTREKNPQQEDSQGKNKQEDIHKNTQEKNPQQEDSQGKNRQEDIHKNTQEKNPQQENNHGRNIQEDMQEKYDQGKDNGDKNELVEDAGESERCMPENTVNYNNKEKMMRLQELLRQFLGDTVRENTREIVAELKESILKELDYQFRNREELDDRREQERQKREEQHFKDIDAVLREKTQRRKHFFEIKNKNKK
ncbi:MAG: MerR family transcriptional regulator [Lachnospiraceae bacterium]|nr:MerR family transcriptional regulator [Lachnospiraceae bacterium]